MEFLPSSTEELSEFDAKKLLYSAEAKVGVRPKYLFVDATQRHDRLKRAATALGIQTVPEEGKNLDDITVGQNRLCGPCQKRSEVMKPNKSNNFTPSASENLPPIK
jgi:hypothetical protein